MVSDRKREANRQNAKRSTGPRTPGGKTRSAQNAIKHGLYSTFLVLSDADLPEWQTFKTGFDEAFNPEDAAEKILVELIAATAWRARRALNVEAGAKCDPALIRALLSVFAELRAWKNMGSSW